MSENNAPRRSTKGKIALIALAVVVVIALAAYWLTADYRAYSRAVALQDAGDHSGALAILETIPDYQDAPERINVCCYACLLYTSRRCSRTPCRRSPSCHRSGAWA